MKTLLSSMGILLALVSNAAFAAERPVSICKFQMGSSTESVAFSREARGTLCELTTDASGQIYSKFFTCTSSVSQTARAANGAGALLLGKNLGDGVLLYTQLNVPANFSRLRTYSAIVRLLNRAPRDLAQPLQVSPARGVYPASCVNEMVRFED